MALEKTTASVALLYSSKDILQNAAVDLHELSRKLHAVEVDRSVNTHETALRKMLQLKTKRNNEQSDQFRKDIQWNVQLATRFTDGGAVADLTSALMEMEDSVKFDTKRMRRVLQRLYRQIHDLDAEISKVQSEEGSFAKFVYLQQRRALKVNSLELQLNIANKKLNMIRSELKILKVELDDANQASQFLHHRLRLKAQEQLNIKNSVLRGTR